MFNVPKKADISTRTRKTTTVKLTISDGFNRVSIESLSKVYGPHDPLSHFKTFRKHHENTAEANFQTTLYNVNLL